MTTTPKKKSRLDPEALPRRDFLGLAAIGSALSAMVFALLGILRLPKAAVLPSPSRKFGVTLPESLPPGTPFEPPGRSVALYRDPEGVYAISLICPHLGCVVKPDADGFHCPCHGSRFRSDGSVTKGPAPTALAWLEVRGGGGTYVVDESRTVALGTKEDA